MKSIFLSIVIICTLAIAGLGGTLATWSDSETSFNNYVETGSLDLKVNGADDLPWGTGVPAKAQVTCMIPEKYYGPYEVELWNAGQCQFPSHAYLHVKRVECSNVEPKVNPYPVGGSALWPAATQTGYADPPDRPVGADYVPPGSLYKPEPELVAEYGGKVDCVTVPGIGPEGDDCSMSSHIVMYVTDTTAAPNVPDSDRTILISNELKDWLCEEVYLFDLMPCVPKTIYLWFYMQQDSEENWGYDFIPDPGDTGFDLLYWQKFNDWPSWALMKDKAELDIEFDLWLEDTPGGVVNPVVNS